MTKNKVINIACILGIICCTELAIIYYQANYNLYAEPSFCNINDFVDCDGIAQTSKSVFLGIPLTYWGFILYTFILMLLYSDKLKEVKFLKFLKVFKNPYYYISTLGIISFVISIFLAFMSIFQIHKICILCFVTYFINLAIGLIAGDFSLRKIREGFKISFSDFISGVREETIPFVTAVILIGIFLTYTNTEMPFASRKQSIKHYTLLKHNPYKISGNYLGNRNGKIKVDLYSDFVCPVCYSYNIMLHKIAKKEKEVYIVHHNFPLDTECNPYLEKQMHKGACRMARFSIAAENQGKYWDMANAIFEKHPKTDAEGISIAEEIGLNINEFIKDINSKQTYDRIKKEIDEAIMLGLDGTPNIIVNGKRYFGAKSYHELKNIILNTTNENGK